jgi:hypothetical protein
VASGIVGRARQPAEGLIRGQQVVIYRQRLGTAQRVPTLFFWQNNQSRSQVVPPARTASELGLDDSKILLGGFPEDESTNRADHKIGQLRAPNTLFFRANQQVSHSLLDLYSLEIERPGHSKLEPGKFELMIEGAVSLLCDNQTASRRGDNEREVARGVG